MSFLIVENLDDSDQFMLGRDFVRNYDVTIELIDRVDTNQGPRGEV